MGKHERKRRTSLQYVTHRTLTTGCDSVPGNYRNYRIKKSTFQLPGDGERVTPEVQVKFCHICWLVTTLSVDSLPDNRYNTICICKNCRYNWMVWNLTDHAGNSTFLLRFSYENFPNDLVNLRDGSLLATSSLFNFVEIGEDGTLCFCYQVTP